MRIRAMLTSLALAGSALTACGGGDGGVDPPVPGTLTVNLTAAATSPGAILMTISGGEITSVAVNGYTKYEAILGTTSRSVLLTGNIVVGPLVTVQVPDISAAGNYTVSVQQVAARATAAIPYKQETPIGYPVSIQ